ncbi:MAG: hypothetical protein Q4B80_03320 [Aerococcaceae bacterium]|nr:hypothetical protein [Aerococcaceae bacterium]
MTKNRKLCLWKMLEWLVAGIMVIVLAIVITGDLGWHDLKFPIDLVYIVIFVALFTDFTDKKQRQLHQ